MKKSNSPRPVRLATFQIFIVANDDVYETNTLSGEFVKKSDVHYCAEKDAIDYVMHYLENCDECWEKMDFQRVSHSYRPYMAIVTQSRW